MPSSTSVEPRVSAGASGYYLELRSERSGGEEVKERVAFVWGLELGV